LFPGKELSTQQEKKLKIKFKGDTQYGGILKFETGILQITQFVQTLSIDTV